MKTEKILIVDDDADWLENCVRILGRDPNYRIMTATNRTKAIQAVKDNLPDLVLTDLRMPQEKDGIELLKSIRQMDPDITVILCTGFATYETALESGREGAFDYLSKPLESTLQLQNVVARGLSQRRLRLENRNMRQQLEDLYGLDNMIGSSPAMQDVFKLVRKVAKSDATVLIQGKSGTGKELIARSLHANSPRVKCPFVPVDCAALPSELLESELFGYEKGAFTGAHKTKIGLFEAADTGTLFMDEIGEMPTALQPKVLRALQERSFRRLGGGKEIQVDIRVVAATNRVLQQEVERGNFREDLYYRINVVLIQLPTLCERLEDVPLLAIHLLDQTQAAREGKVTGISEAAMNLLMSYQWPGNVRQLRNAIEYATALADEPAIQPNNLPDFVRDTSHQYTRAIDMKTELRKFSVDIDTSVPFKAAKDTLIKRFEQAYLDQLLDEHDGNISQAAIAADIDRKTIHRLVKNNPSTLSA
jgi:DNA-binding NtrC family response regulator